MAGERGFRSSAGVEAFGDSAGGVAEILEHSLRFFELFNVLSLSEIPLWDFRYFAFNPV